MKKSLLCEKALYFIGVWMGGKAKHWQRFEEVSLVLAGLCTPLVFSVHSIVSMDFATSVIPGWHTTIFPPYFVLGALFSGFAMVETLLIIVRKVVNMEAYITIKHIEYMNVIILLTGSLVGVAYITELFMAWYSGVEFEQYAFLNRATGPYWWAYASMMTCNVIIPQLYWIYKIRTSFVATFILSIFVNIGMWFERFVIIVTSLHRDFLPSSWTMFSPSFVDIGIFLGTIGFFFVLFLIYARSFPVIAQAELKVFLNHQDQNIKVKMKDKIIHAIFDDENDVLTVVKDLKDNDIVVSEVYSPFPIHGQISIRIKRDKTSYYCIYLWMYWFMLWSVINLLYYDFRSR